MRLSEDQKQLIRQWSKDDDAYHNLIALFNQQSGQTLLEDLPASIVIADAQQPDHPTVFVNATFTRETGYSPEDVMGKNMRLLQGTDRDQPERAIIRQAIKQEAPCQVVLRNYRKDGTMFWNELYMTPVRDESGTVIRFIGVQHDITEHHQHRETIYRLITENISEGIIVWDVTRQQSIYASPSYKRQWGRQPGDSIGMTVEEAYDLIHPEDRDELFEQIAQAIRQQAPALLYTYRGKHQDGHYYWKEDHATFFYAPDGTRAYVISRDITERKQIDATQEAAKAALRRLTQQIPIGIQVFDTHGLCVDVNQAHLDIFGVTRDDLVGHYNILADPLAEHMPTQQAAQQALAGESTRLGDIVFDFSQADPRYADAKRAPRTINVTIVPIFDEQNRVANIVGVNMDVTERIHAQQRALELALENERHRLLIAFIQDAAHEFRTPLSIINSTAYLMSRLDDIESRQAKNAQINQQVERIARLLDMLTMIVQLANEHQEPRRSIDVGAVVRHMCQNYITKYGQQPTLHYDIRAQLPFIPANSQYLNEAFQQVMDNAYRATPPDGTITVALKQINQSIRLTVADSGPGIPEDLMPHIFKTFWREDQAHTTAGFGLGLPIAQRIIERYGGSIRAESVAGQGATFIIELPINY